jgi:hypothetical protein
LFATKTQSEGEESGINTIGTNGISINSSGGVYKLKCRIKVRGHIQKKNDTNIEEMQWPSEKIKSLTFFWRMQPGTTSETHQCDAVGSLLQEKTRKRLFGNISQLYTEILPEYEACHDRSVRLRKVTCGMTLSI